MGDTPRPAHRDGYTYHFTIEGEQQLDGYLTVNLWNGEVREVFLVASKHGGIIRGMIDSLAVLISNALQHGMPLYEVCKALIGITFEPKGPTTDKEVPMCTSVSDYIGRKLAANLAPYEREQLGLQTTAHVQAAPGL